ncbi:cold-shock protein [Acidisoma silvae]|uniref:Cold-shock protein n=1 Tax=Acidisoma silvae TaxID=2802396 RepID=A0A964E135_9PROT|nr:cold-shock protein [Acidisoma silvae]MCB8877802.1 cold-shock protein [Acidisoma silvae]
MAIGSVKWFNLEKGFGFIRPVSPGPDVFVHIASVHRAGLSGLTEGQKIHFDAFAHDSSGKMAAENLKVL